MSDFRIITTSEELEALAREDAGAIVLAGEAGAVRTVRALAAMHRLGSVWGLPAVVIASGGTGESSTRSNGDREWLLIRVLQIWPPALIAVTRILIPGNC